MYFLKMLKKKKVIESDYNKQVTKSIYKCLLNLKQKLRKYSYNILSDGHLTF